MLEWFQLVNQAHYLIITQNSGGVRYPGYRINRLCPCKYGGRCGLI